MTLYKLVDTESVEAQLQRTLTEQEQLLYPELETQLIDIVEGYLNHRAVYNRQFVEIRQSPGSVVASPAPIDIDAGVNQSSLGFGVPGGMVRFGNGPVTSMVSMTSPDGSFTISNPEFYRTGNSIYLPPSQVGWKLTYMAGDLTPRPAITGLLRDVLSRSFSVTPQIGLGVVTSYSVEGTSISYGPAVTGSDGSVGRFGMADLKSISQAKRIVVA